MMASIMGRRYGLQLGKTTLMKSLMGILAAKSGS